MDKIIIAVPNNGLISSETSFGLIRAAQKDQNQRKILTDFYDAQGLFVDNNRNNIVDGFLNLSNEKWLLFVDSDIHVNLEHIYTLYDIATNNKLDILGGIYFYSKVHRSMELRPALQNRHPDGKRYDIYDIDFELDYFEVNSMGTGLMLISREALEKTYKVDTSNLPYWFKTYDENGNFIAEDIYFCETAKSVGIKTYACPKVTPNHVKLSYFSKEEYLKQQRITS